MKNLEKPSNAEVAAEAGHFRSEAINQELKTGKRQPLTVDPMMAQLPSGMQVTHPTYCEPGDAEARLPAVNSGGDKAADAHEA